MVSTHFKCDIASVICSERYWLMSQGFKDNYITRRLKHTIISCENLKHLVPFAFSYLCCNYGCAMAFLQS